MEDKIREIEIHLTEIKADLKHHIRRTDLLQDMVEPIYKSHLFFSYCLKALVPVSILAGIAFTIKEFL